MPPINWKPLAAFPRIIRVVFLTVFLISPIPAQYQLDQWTADNGLPQNSVYSILKTRDGYLWLATVDGLVRFDGAKFTVFNTSNTPGIISNRFVSLVETANGDLWAATEQSGVVRMHDGRFSSYGKEQGAKTVSYNLMMEDEKGNALLFPQSFESTRFDGEKFVPYQPTPFGEPNATERKNKYLPCLLDETNIKCFFRGNWKYFKVPAYFLSSLDISLVRAVEDKNGSLWITEQEKGLTKIKPDGSSKFYNESNGLPGKTLFIIPGEEKISLLSQDKQGAIWLTDMAEMKSELVTRQPPKSFNALAHSYQDAEGSIWIGTLRGGLFRLRKQVINSYSTSEGLWDNNIYPIYQDRRGVIWVGSGNGLFKEKNGIFELVKGSESLAINSLGETPDGRLLASYYYSEAKVPAGLLILEQDQLKPFYSPGLYGLDMKFAIYADDENALWFGGWDSLVRFKDGVATFHKEKDGLAGNDIRIIISDGNGGLWVGSYGGLTHYKDGKLQKWTETEGLPARTIRALYLDSEGVLWIGSYDKGLIRFKDGKFTSYTTQNGLYNDGAFQILEDDQRNFWLCSNRGIYRVRKDELNEFAEGKRDSINSIAYGKSDGMLNVECNGGRMPGGIKARDGRLWFPTQDGVAVVDPKEVKSNPNPPPVVIEEFRIDNKSVGFEIISSAIRNPQSKIQIEPSQQNFEINYTALSFINAENLRFKYKLEGLDTDWVDAGTRRTAYFSHVLPGEYTFRVIAANADGVWNETGQSLKISVLPPFYRTWWFLVLSVFGITILVYLFFKRRIIQIERQRQTQQNFSRQLIASQEAERKRIAAELHDSLGQRLVVIKNLAWMFLSAAKNGNKNQIEELSEEASNAINEVKAISYNLRPYQLDRIGLTKAIEAIIRSAQTASEIDFSSEIDNIDDYFPKDSEINFYRIVQESVNNIFKHSQATKAKIEIKRESNILNLTIEDNGQGFEKENSKIQNPKSGGFGLLGITERVDLLSGQIEIKSASGQGTVLKILIKSN